MKESIQTKYNSVAKVKVAVTFTIEAVGKLLWCTKHADEELGEAESLHTLPATPTV